MGGPEFASSRLDVLRMLYVLDTPAEPAFDAIVRSASRICDCPISLMSLVDVDRQWFKAQVGLDARETPLDQSFCAHAIREDKFFEIPDARGDARFADNPLVTGDPLIRFYAGQPIVFDGVALGTLCVIDRVPRSLDDGQREQLRSLAIVVAELLHGRMQAMLHRREAERLRDFARMSGDWLWESDVLHRRTWLSSDPAPSAGLFEAFPAGIRFRDLEVLDWVGRPTTGPRLLGLLARNEPFSNAVVEIGDGAQRRFVSLSAVPMRGASGEATGFRGSAKEVTDRIVAEVEGRDREALLRKITGQVPGSIYQYRQSAAGAGTIPFASEGIRDVLELSPDEVRDDASAIHARIHPDDLEDFRGSVDASQADGTPWNARFRVRLPVKGVRWLQALAVSERMPDGGTLWTGYIMDVTEAQARDGELAEAHRALVASERSMRALTDNIPAMIARVGRDERYTFANAGVGQMLAIDPASLLGRSMREIRDQEGYDYIKPHIDRALAGERVAFERSNTINGRHYHHHSVYVPDVGPDGDIVGFYAMTFDMTWRKDAELAQARSEKLLRGVTDNLPALVCYVDNDDRYLFANGTYRTWFGLDNRAMVGHAIRDFIDDEAWQAAQPHVERARAGERQSVERRMLFEDGVRHLLSEFVPDFDETGAVVGIYAMTTDITERRAAELRLIDSEKRLLDITNNMPAVIGQFDMGERCVFANDVGLRAYDLTRADMAGLTFSSQISEELYAMHAPAIRAVLAGETRTVDGYRTYKNRTTWFKAHLIPQFDSAGVQGGFYVMSFDVTSLKVAQAEREHSEARLRQITDALPVLISYINADERMTYANETYRRRIGAVDRDIIGLPVREAIGPALYAQRKDYIRRGLAGEAVSFELESQVLGAMRNLQITYLPDVQSDGRVVGITTMSVDMTDLKAAERHLSQLAHCDALTGLPNRLLFNRRLDEALSDRSAASGATAVMFLDVDRFKAINDTHGHGVGDCVLVEFAKRVQRSVRTTDFVARLAGDEFVVILKGLGKPAEAEAIARKIVKEVERPFVVAGRKLRVTTSVGVALQDETTETAPELLARADHALYRAKESGRNTFQVATALSANRPALVQ